MTPQALAKPGKEHDHQRALIAWSNMAGNYGIRAADDPRSYEVMNYAKNHASEAITPLKYLYAIHNQGHGDAVRGARAKAEGVKSGVPDLFLPVINKQHIPFYAGLYIELKKPKTGVVSNVQNLFIEYLFGAGYAVEICYGWLEARDALLRYLGIKEA